MTGLFGEVLLVLVGVGALIHFIRRNRGRNY